MGDKRVLRRACVIVHSDDDFIEEDSKFYSSKVHRKRKHDRSTCMVPLKVKSRDSDKFSDSARALAVSNDSDREEDASNCSVLEKSSLYFPPGQIDPRARMIVTRTKSSLESIDKDLKEVEIKQASIREKWDTLFDKFGSSKAEEKADKKREFSFFVDTSSSDDFSSDEDSGDLEIVDPGDESRKSSKENSGKELARYLQGHSSIVKRNLCALPQFTEEDALLQISGSMSTDLCQGKLSNYKDTITIKAFGFNLSFSRDYLDTIRAMTGCDIRRVAYKIEMAGPEAPAVKNIEDVKVLRKVKTLKNPSLVNESVTSEMNLSLKSSKLLQTSISKPSANRSSSRHNTTPSSDVTKFNKAAMELRLRNMFSSPKFKVEKDEVKTSEHQQNNILNKKSELNRSKRAELSLLKMSQMFTPQKPKLEQLDTSSDLKNLNDTSINTSSETTQSRRVKRVLSMLTPHKAQPSRQAQTTGCDVTKARNQENTISVCAKTVKIEKTDLQYRETTPFSKVSPDLERCKLNTTLSLNAISPLKRNHIQCLDVTQEGSPSKRIRFHDKSVLSSTRIDDLGCGEEDEVPHCCSSRQSCSSRQRMYDNHRQYYRSSDMGPANGYCSTVQGPIVSHSGNCRGSCCQTHALRYKVEHNHDPYSDQHSYKKHTMLGKYEHREPRQSAVLHDRDEQQSIETFRYLQEHDRNVQEHRHHEHFSRHERYPSHSQLYDNTRLYSPYNPSRYPGMLKQCSNLSYRPQQRESSYDLPQPTHNRDRRFRLSPEQHDPCPEPSRRITRQSIRKDKHLEDKEKIIDCKEEKENIPDSKQLTPANSAISKSAIEIPIVTQLLKGLNSNNKKLRINVAYDVKLAEDCIKND